MSEPMHMQVAVPASPDDVFRAWTETSSLTEWFAECADVNLDARRFDYWGRFTPGCPDRDKGRHQVEAVDRGRHLRWSWQLHEVTTDVALTLMPRGDGTIVIVRHMVPRDHDSAVPNFEDFWFLSLENLRRHLRGGDVVRCDFAAIRDTGDISHSLLIDGSPDEVFGALIRPDQMNRWIASNATVEPVVGGAYDLGWGFGALKILELIPNEKVAISWPETAETVVTWTLEESGGKTRLTLVHSGFAADFSNSGLNSGWLNFMSWVKSMVEEGSAWKPAVIALPENMRAYYPRSIGASQNEIVDPQ